LSSKDVFRDYSAEISDMCVIIRNRIRQSTKKKFTPHSTDGTIDRVENPINGKCRTIHYTVKSEIEVSVVEHVISSLIKENLKSSAPWKRVARQLSNSRKMLLESKTGGR